jgi:hypothetical protein
MMIMDNKSDISSKVLEKIGHGDVRKHSRAYFVVQMSLIIVLFILALALAMFVLSFGIFTVHESGEQFLLGFGSRGVLAFFALFPWMALIIDILLFAIIEWLLRRFKFGYRIPVLRAVLGIIVLAVAGGVIVMLTPLHATLLQRAQNDALPVLGEWYEAIDAPHADQGAFCGTISSINGNTFVIVNDDGDRDVDDGTWTVLAPAGFDMASINVGDRVYVAGSVPPDGPAQGIIQAYGVGKLTSDR